MFATLDFAPGQLPQDRPRYLMGVGKPDDLVGAVERGVDINDPEAMNALAADPGFQSEFQAYVMNTPELAVELAQAMAWPSHWGFWIVVVLVGRWFAKLPSRQA